MLSVISTIRISEKLRFQNLLSLLNVFSNLEIDHEIVIVEQDSSSRIPKELIDKHNLKHRFLKWRGAFNRSWGLNCGFHASSGEVLLFTDSDLILENATILQAICNLSKYDVINPYKKLIDFNKTFVESFPTELDHFPSRTGLNISGGSLFVRRDAFEKTGGWPEEIVGWGTEDNIMSEIIIKRLSWKNLDDVAIHLRHDRTNNTLNPFSEMNKKILEQYLDKLSDENKGFSISQGVPKTAPLQLRIKQLKTIASHRKLVASGFFYRSRIYRQSSLSKWVLDLLRGFSLNPVSIQIIKELGMFRDRASNVK